MLLLPGFNSLAANALIDPFRAANYIQGSSLYRWDWVGLDKNPVTASNGLRSDNISANLDHIGKYDFVVINASWTPEKINNPELKDWLTVILV